MQFAEQTIAEQDIVAIIAQEGRVDAALLTPDANLAELDIQSLEIVEIVFALEETFHISIPFNANGATDADSAANLKTVRDIVELVNRLVSCDSLDVAAAN